MKLFSNFRFAMGLAFMLFLASCSVVAGGIDSYNPIVTPLESFTFVDTPKSIMVDGFPLVGPWGYQRASNAKRLYPLVVNGCWGEGSEFNLAVRQKYPAFFLDFNNYSTEEHGRLLADLIDAIKYSHRIDLQRIYLTGFSQGGSGSYKLVRGMLSKQKLFAAIIRCAGQSETVLAPEAVQMTSVWYHIGLDDDAARVNVARETWDTFKADLNNSTAYESSYSDTITGYGRTTKTLTKRGVEIFKMSEYIGMGHTPGPCYQDPALFDWLFSQSLQRR